MCLNIPSVILVLSPTLRLDIRNMISPRQPETSVPAGPSSTASPAPAETDTPNTYAPNVLEIDWESLIEQEPDATIREIHQFFSQRTPSSQNEYTGMFAGKTSSGSWRRASAPGPSTRS